MPLPFDKKRLLRTPGFFEEEENAGYPPARPIPLSTAGDPGELPAPPSPVSYDRPTRRQRYESERDAYMRTTPSRGRSALTGALQGFLGGGGLVGAVTGAASGAIDPRGLREQQFYQRRRPQLMEQFAFEDADQAAQRQAAEDEINARYKIAQIGALGSQNAERAGNLEISRQNAQRQAAVADSTIALNQARAEAVRTGKLVTRDITGDDGVVRTYQLHPDGGMTLLGGSAKAAINKTNIQSREKIATQRLNRPRAAPQPKGEPKVASISQVRKAAEEHFGGDVNEAKAAFVRKGYRIVGR